MDFRKKIIAWDELPAWRTALRAAGKTLVVTNGHYTLAVKMIGIFGHELPAVKKVEEGK